VEEGPRIVITEDRIDPDELSRLVSLYFGNMVKIVVDVRRCVMAVGGELHADGEEMLLAEGSRQDDLWGANYYPARGEDCIEYTAMMNIRPAQGHPSMEIANAEIREAIRAIALEILGEGGTS
jgi:hypothetical protein